MIYSFICIISASNSFILSLILTLLITKSPVWLIRSNLKLLAHIQYFIFFSVGLLLLSLYEAQDSSISRNSILLKEIPKSLSIIVLIICLVTIYLHTIRQQWLESEKNESIKNLDPLIQNFIIFLVLILNTLSFFLGSLFAFASSIPLLLIPKEIGDDGYWVSHLSKNEGLYWKNNLFLQSFLSFRYIVLACILDNIKWPIFEVFSKFFNSKVVWDVMFMWMDFETKYQFDNNLLIIEILALIIMAIVAIQSFIGSSLVNKHLAPLTVLVTIFCSSNTLRAFAFTLAIRLGFVLELYS